MGALWVVAGRPAFHTGCMAGDAVATTFITGADGFIGTELIRVLTARGHQVFGLTRSIEGAQRVRRAGAVPVMGDLLEPGQWQDEAAADWVFQLPPQLPCKRRVTRRHRLRPRAGASGPVLADYIASDAVLSNIRLRGTDFHFHYPTLEHGFEQVLGALHE